MAKSKNVLIVAGILVVLLLMITIFPVKQPIMNNDEVKKFSSLDELKTFLKESQSSGYFRENSILKTTALAAPEAAGSGSGSADYSQTNIQVKGVDEADIVKNDDKYIYIVSQDKISIIDAYPAENSKILANLNVNGTVNEIFINNNKLIVFGQENYRYSGPMPIYSGPMGPMPLETGANARIALDIIPQIYYPQKSFIKIYDITDKENPELDENIIFDGDYYDSRMINNYVYAIANQPVVYREDDVILPMITKNSIESPVRVNDIYYFDILDYNYRLTTIMAINLDDNNMKKESFLTGYTQTIFVSENNIYLTSQKYVPYQDYQKRLFEETYAELVDEDTASKLKDALEDNDYNKFQETLENYYNKLNSGEKEQFDEDLAEKTSKAEAKIQKETQKTIIHKISINENNIEYKSRGEVPGNVLNQFSMDEYQDSFRIATTTSWQDSLNHVYILDNNLKITGKLEDLAHGERIYSARFINDKAYMVTFRQIDPLFVIDLSNTENPKVLGYLKIPGVSDYLHPYDENHVIGIGRDASEEGRIQGMKLSLFDVSDVENPKEISKYMIGERGTNSEALNDHKAFLFDKEKELLVIPVTLYEKTDEYEEFRFDGAYVFSLNLDEGFKLKGKITHLSDEDLAKVSGERYYYPDYNKIVRRSLYIDNALYTISNKFLKINDLSNLNEINTIKLPFKEDNYAILY